ncbi:hypothetical protein AB3N60_16150 [Leptospira sp. WS39.C2]
MANPNTIGTNISENSKKDKTISKPKVSITHKKEIKSNTKSSIINLKNHKGNWKPMDLVWEESSGAVSPEYRFAKLFHLQTDSKKIFLSRKIVKNGKLELDETKEISSNVYHKWMNDLFKKGIHQLASEKIPEEQITGISYNFVSFRFGSTKSKFYYRLDDKIQPDWKQKREIVNYIERMKP